MVAFVLCGWESEPPQATDTKLLLELRPAASPRAGKSVRNMSDWLAAATSTGMSTGISPAPLPAAGHRLMQLMHSMALAMDGPQLVSRIPSVAAVVFILFLV